MAGGLVALLDDIAALTKLAAASLDDVSAAAGRAGVKAAGVVIDDTAVTPSYVVGLKPERELPIIRRIATGSLRNKLLILLPLALLLSWLAPWALTPLLMMGGAFLCFEGAEKVLEKLGLHGHAHGEDASAAASDPAELERATVSGAVRTDLILSAEIMAIALGDVAAKPLWEQAVVLIIVGLAITVGVYGAVAVIVKMDDVGLHLSRRPGAATQTVGRGLVKAMPVVMSVLATVGTAAMVWVGGGIVLHGLEKLGFGAPQHALDGLAEAAAAPTGPLYGLVHWLVEAAEAGVVGLILGGAVVGVVALIPRRAKPAR